MQVTKKDARPRRDVEMLVDKSMLGGEGTYREYFDTFDDLNDAASSDQDEDARLVVALAYNMIRWANPRVREVVLRFPEVGR